MALVNIQESVTLTAESRFGEGNALVVQFTAHIPSDGISGAVQQNIRETGLFEQYRREIRQDQTEFQNEVWDVEDRMSNGELVD